MSRRRARADQRHGQQRLSVTGLERVQRTERDRKQQRADHDERIAGTLGEDIGQRVRASDRRHRARGGRGFVGDDHAVVGSDPACGVDARRERDARARRTDQRARVRAQLGGRLGLSAGDDVFPAEAAGFGVVAVRETMRATAGACTIGSGEIQRRQPARARPRANRRSGRRQRDASPVDDEVQLRCDLVRMRISPCRERRVRGRSVRVERAVQRERRNLRHVEHVADRHGIARARDAREMVHREIPQRMCRCGGGRSHQRSSYQTGHPDETSHELPRSVSVYGLAGNGRNRQPDCDSSAPGAPRYAFRAPGCSPPPLLG